MRARTNLFIDAGILAGYLVATNPVTTGTPVHEWLSIGLALVALVHLVVHWGWTVRTARRFLVRLGALPRVNLIVDVALLVAIVTCVMSGLAVSRSALAFAGRVVSDASIWHAVHSESSTVLLALVGMHLGLHWSWIVAVSRHQITQLRRHSGTARATGIPRPDVARSGRRLASRGADVAGPTAWVLAAVAVVAVSVWAIAPASQNHLSWLVLPGGATLARGPEAIAAASASPTTAAGFAGSASQRVVVRVSHSLIVLFLATGAGVALRELFRNN